MVVPRSVTGTVVVAIAILFVISAMPFPHESDTEGGFAEAENAPKLVASVLDQGIGNPTTVMESS
jgi:hypothetical protein